MQSIKQANKEVNNQTKQTNKHTAALYSLN